MDGPATELRAVEVGELGERLSALRLCEASAVEEVRRSLAQHGQLSALVLCGCAEGLEIVDGFKRVHAARALGMRTLVARVDEVSWVDAKLRLCALQERRGLTDLEEAWLVRSLYREDQLNLPEIARLMSRHKSWVWRRLMLAEALEPSVQIDVRLGLIAPRAAVAVSRLPRGNQQSASAVVMRRGLTVRQTELLVDEALAEADLGARAHLLERRLTESGPLQTAAIRPTRAVRGEADWMSADILKVREVAARLTARLSATPLETFPAAASELLCDALIRLVPVLRALDGVIGTATARRDVA